MTTNLDKYINDTYFFQYTIDTLEEMGLNEAYFKSYFLKPYMAPHRFFHNIEHIKSILVQIHRDYFINNAISEAEVKILVFATWFHDIVYVPSNSNNEEESVQTFKVFEKYTGKNIPYVEEIILDTKHHNATLPLSKRFCAYDMRGLYTKDFTEIQEGEYAIFKEFQLFPYDAFKAGRLSFLQKELEKEDSKEIKEALAIRINYVKNFVPQIGIYAGSFNPFHIGHLNILTKAEEQFDKVIVLHAQNPDKTGGDYYADKDRNLFDRLKFRQVDILQTGKTLVSYINQLESETNADYTLIRGLRNGDDLNYEINQQFYLKKLKADLKTVLFLSDPEFFNISSSGIRGLLKLEGNNAKDYIV